MQMNYNNVMSVFTVILYVLINTIYCVKGQLIVNVLNKGGEITRETIVGNITLDIIHLDFEKFDGTKVQQFIDFKNDIQIFRVIIPPDQNIVNDKTTMMCFITLLQKDSFISPDAMSKLRQKNPSTTRVPETVLPLHVHDFDSVVYDVDGDAAASVSDNLASVCSPSTLQTHDLVDNDQDEDENGRVKSTREDAEDAREDARYRAVTYARRKDVKTLAESRSTKNYELMISALKPQTFLEEQSSPLFCNAASTSKSSKDSSCICIYRVLIGWYPCGLKYCKGKDTLGKPINYRCGIKTCSISHRFNYVTDNPSSCISDDP